jgi:hypothetical protein
MIPVRTLSKHIAHGTAAVAVEKHLSRKHEQLRLERKVERLFPKAWIKELISDPALDH